jgi:outer membrane protein
VPYRGYGWLVIATGIAFFSPLQDAVPAEVLIRLSLEESVQLALAKSLSLHSVQEGIKEAVAHKYEAASLFFPKISTSYSFTRLNAPPFFYFPGLPPLLPPNTMVVGTKENYNWALELRQTLYAGGAIRAGYEIGLIGEDIARSNVQTVRADIIREVKVAYFRILNAARIVHVAQQNVAGLQTHRDQAQIFYNHGLIPQNDLLTAEVELANGHQLLVRAQNGVELAKAGMNTLLRREIDAPLELEDVFDYRPIDKTWEDCLKAVRDNRPEIRSHILQTKQAEKVVEQAKSNQFSG